MPVTRKPQTKDEATGQPSETAIRTFIERGGSVSGEETGDVRTKLVQLRLSPRAHRRALIARVARSGCRPRGTTGYSKRSTRSSNERRHREAHQRSSA